jgi:WhiB family redox-sensing transcriptional regulator
MPVIRTAGTPWYTGNITAAELVLAHFIAAATQRWARQALCGQTDPDLFFSDSASQTELAKAICKRCPVREECLAHALETREDFGVWGGLDRDERRRLLRRKAAGPDGKGTA